MFQLYRENCLNILKKMKTNSIDSIVTDPPYGISIMNQKWDKNLPGKEIWKECLRVLKPGGHIIAFSSTRHYHYLASSMEEVGFETRNMMAWLYGNGYPRGVDVAAQLDRNDGLPRPDDSFRNYLKKAIKRSPYTIRELEALCGTNGMFSHYLGRVQSQFPSMKNWKIIKEALRLDSTYDSLFETLEKKRALFNARSKERRKNGGLFPSVVDEYECHIPKCEDARKWQGWRHGSLALRPCMESIYWGQKPPLKPVSDNIKTHGLGALNIEGCKTTGRDGKKRFPGNVLHDGSPEVVEGLDKGSPLAVSSLGEFPFLYVPKPRTKERAGNPHPTLKPLSLMRHLVRLITPPNGVCLDPFMGSGTTGVACLMEGMNFIGVEREQDYFEVTWKRIVGRY